MVDGRVIDRFFPDLESARAAADAIRRDMLTSVVEVADLLVEVLYRHPGVGPVIQVPK